MQIIGSLPCQDHGHISLCILTDVSVDSERLTPELVPDCPSVFPPEPSPTGPMSLTSGPPPCEGVLQGTLPPGGGGRGWGWVWDTCGEEGCSPALMTDARVRAFLGRPRKGLGHFISRRDAFKFWTQCGLCWCECTRLDACYTY